MSKPQNWNMEIDPKRKGREITDYERNGDSPSDHRILPGQSHTKISWSKEANTNPGKGVEVRPMTNTFGDTAPMSYPIETAE